MGYIKEPEGIDFTVDPTPLTTEDKKRISEIIAYYKATGKKMPIQKTSRRNKIHSKVKKLDGVLKQVEIKNVKKEYHKHLEEKYSEK